MLLNKYFINKYSKKDSCFGDTYHIRMCHWIHWCTKIVSYFSIHFLALPINQVHWVSEGSFLLVFIHPSIQIEEDVSQRNMGIRSSCTAVQSILSVIINAFLWQSRADISSLGCLLPKYELKLKIEELESL